MLSLARPVAAVLREESATVRAWSEPADSPGVAGEAARALVADNLIVEFIARDGFRLTGSPQLTLPGDAQSAGIKIVSQARELDGSDPVDPDRRSTRRVALGITRERAEPPRETAVALAFRYAALDRDEVEHSFDGQLAVLLVPHGAGTRGAPEAARAADVAAVGGSLELVLGHLCDQQGCAEHLRKSLGAVPSLVGLRPEPNLEAPRAIVYVAAGQAPDLWGLRETLRDQGIEIRTIRARDMGAWMLHIELERWQEAHDAAEMTQCTTCRELSLHAARSVPGVGDVTAAGGGITLALRDRAADLGILLDALDDRGVVPRAVWLVPEAVPMPRAGTPRPQPPGGAPKRGGSEAHALIELNFGHLCTAGPDVLGVLDAEPWASRTGQAPDRLGAIPSSRVLEGASVLAAMGDRQIVDLVGMLRDLRAAGRRPGQMRLAVAGDIRIECEFAHICGEIEYSKPPEEKKPETPTEKREEQEDRMQKTNAAEPRAAAEQEEPPKKKEDPSQKDEAKEKPFVPQPLRPADSSNGRQAIERVLAGIDWIRDAAYAEYHTKPGFNDPRRLFLACTVSNRDGVPVAELIRALTRAGFPPTALRVSRLFPGIPFGDPLPGDLDLVSSDGARTALLGRPGRPLAVAFVSLHCPHWDKYKYEAEPAHYRQLKETIDKFRDRVDFFAVSSNPDDEFGTVEELMEKAELHVPVLYDSEGRLRAVMNAQITPAPHLYVFDGDRRLRYAGDAHDNWEKPGESHEDFLSQGLERLLGNDLAENGAVFFNSPRCNCSSPNCKCPKCGCGPSCRCDVKH